MDNKNSTEELKRLLKQREIELAEKDREIQKLKKTRLGLYWDKEREPEQVVLDCENNLPVFKRIKDKEIKSEKGEENILIEGDNFHALTCLNYTHQGKIDVIYIDPPYNTGKDFIYNDKKVDENDGYRHSKWLNFMEKRLILAKNLLKKTGVIFISIDDNEQANLKLLCDRILGNNNFITSISRIVKTASNKGKFFAPFCDYILLYTKSIEVLNDDSFNQSVNEDLYKKEDGLGKYRDDIAFYQSSLDPMRGCKNQRYYIECPNGSLVIPPGKSFPSEKEDASFVVPRDNNDKVWRWTYETYLAKKEFLVFKETKTSPLLNESGKQSKYNIYTKSYLKDRQKTGVKPRNFLIEKEFLNRKGADYIKNLGIKFSYSKPKKLVEHLIKISNKNNNAIILDFFAGSGTTGEVVLDLNNKDNGNRKFILCTNNENKICEEVTYPRIQKVINGYNKNGNGDFVEGLGSNLHYFKTEFIKKTKSRDKLRINLTKKCTEMLCIKESIFSLEKEEEDYKIFTNAKKDKFLCIYYNLVEKSFDDFYNEVKELKGEKLIYMFSLNNQIDKSLFSGINNFSIEAIPENILNVYQDLVKMTITVKKNLIFSELSKAQVALFKREDKDDGAKNLRVVLEKLLQKICQNNGINLKNDKNKEKKLDTLNGELYKNNILTQLQCQENKAFLVIGNQASHGEYGEYDLGKVKIFYKHCQELINQYIN